MNPPASAPRAGTHRALAIGSGAASELSQGEGPLRVHSVFPSILNLERPGGGPLIALSGPPGLILPHAVALERPGDFLAWPLAAGDPGRYERDRIHIQGMDGELAVDLRGAVRTPWRSMPAITRLGTAHAACLAGLAAFQEEAGCDLRLAALCGPPSSGSGLKAGLASGAKAVGAAARAWVDGPADARARSALRAAAAGMLGLGQGLTPAGDDFLCGFTAAAHCSTPARGLADVLGEALDLGPGRTGAVSASLLAWARRGHWPGPLVDLAMALAAEGVGDALAALGQACWMGHSSGADLATGFLYGLRVLPLEASGFQ